MSAEIPNTHSYPGASMKILFLHGWHSVPGGVKPSYLIEHGHEVINPALDDDDWDAAVRTAQERIRPAPSRRDRGLFSRRGGGDEYRLGRDPSGAPLPSLEEVGNGQGGQARHGHSSLRVRRRDPHRRQPATRAGQRPARVGTRRCWHGPPACRGGATRCNAKGGELVRSNSLIRYPNMRSRSHLLCAPLCGSFDFRCAKTVPSRRPP